MEQEKSLDRDQSVLIFTRHADVFSFVFRFSVFYGMHSCTPGPPAGAPGFCRTGFTAAAEREKAQ